MYLVVGATGYLGGEICRRLVERGKPVRALVRETSAPEKVSRLEALGAEVEHGDLKERLSLDAACSGVSAVLSTATVIAGGQPGDSLQATDEQGQLNLVDAARSAGVGRFLFISFIEVPVAFPMQDAKRAVERALQESGIAYTILRPSNFMETWLGPVVGWDVAGGRVRVLGEGDERRNWVSLGDVAEVAVRAVDDPEAENEVITFAGDYASANELVVAFQEETGRTLDVERVPVDALEAEYDRAEDPVAHTFAGLSLATARGEEDVTAAIRRYVPQPLPAREFLSRAAAAP
jgi:uncharacterized protein YbjT (DUF2867 family)